MGIAKKLTSVKKEPTQKGPDGPFFLSLQGFFAVAYDEDINFGVTHDVLG